MALTSSCPITVGATTSGNWLGVCGTNGHCIADSTTLTNLPSYAQLTLNGQQLQLWTNMATDTRAPLRPGSTSNRVAAAWCTSDTQGSAFTIDLNLTDTNTHQIALYCVNLAGNDSVHQKVELFASTDTAFSFPLDTRDFTLPSNGVYLIWKLKGHKFIRICKPDAAGGSKAMISAIFFD